MTASSLNQGLLKVGILGPAVSNTAAQNQSTVSPLGEIRVENPASQLFLDTFDSGTLDQINKWTATTGGTASSITPSVGSVAIAGGAIANSFAKLTSLLPTTDPASFNTLGSFRPTEPGFLLFHSRINIPAASTTASNLINFGLGTSIASPTIANPIRQFIGFEITQASKLQAVVYQTGTRVLIQDLSVALPNTPPGTPAPQPTDSAAHKYFVYFRGDIAYWAIDDKDNIVAQYQTGASGPDINTLPLLYQVINNGGANCTITLNASTLGDTSHTGGTQLLSNGLTLEPQRSNMDSNLALITLTAQGAGDRKSVV